jgi:hypothetical protein
MKFSEFVELLHYYYIHSASCIASPMNTPLCFKFWGLVYLSAFFVLLLIFYKLLRKILKDRSDWQKYLIKVENRNKIADDETMARSVWRGDL